jgi:hypothetical protein
LASGYLARLPRSVFIRETLVKLVLMRRDYAELYDRYRVRCIVRDGRVEWISR